jgi:hypothetical protein
MGNENSIFMRRTQLRQLLHLSTYSASLMCKHEFVFFYFGTLLFRNCFGSLLDTKQNLGECFTFIKHKPPMAFMYMREYLPKKIKSTSNPLFRILSIDKTIQQGRCNHTYSHLQIIAEQFHTHVEYSEIFAFVASVWSARTDHCTSSIAAKWLKRQRI